MIPDKIRCIRKHKGFSQEELARQLGVSFPTVNSWERGRSQPYPRHQKLIDELYKQVIGEHEQRLVLIVEDDENAAMILADYAEIAVPDWQVTSVDNGYDAILQIGLLRPRLVLLDIMMPQIDGIEVFQRLRAKPELDDVTVVFVTAASDEAILARARAAGAFALLQKPLERSEVVRVIRRAVQEPQPTRT